ncbi:Gfo/Idh/MocA family oxidoreductase [Lacibacterium aquatile]|uniref:Gfo/Idh/MocA family oxidoreductase n=1 Tax=Lacibacterium aquatile TaxID=1168082 RepID=A0ABW5DTT6_9PROT
MSAALSVAVVGAGAMGANHARTLAGMEGVELGYIVDADLTRAKTLAETYGAQALGSIGELPSGVDGAVIATTSVTHAVLGQALLSRGIPCLIEKPLAVTREECVLLIEAADKAGVPVAVGHVERFNPAIRKAAELLKDQTILMMEARRLNPGSARILDTDVIIDLMVHDLDVIQFLAVADPTALSAHGIARNKPGVADHASALLDFDGKVMATVTASRMTQTRIRELLIQTASGLLAVNYLTQEVRASRALIDGSDANGSDLALEPVMVVQGQSLATELAVFCAAIRKGRAEAAGVTPREALRSLRSVWEIQRQLAETWA